jgi:hypothetical protein
MLSGKLQVPMVWLAGAQPSLTCVHAELSRTTPPFLHAEKVLEQARTLTDAPQRVVGQAPGHLVVLHALRFLQLVLQLQCKAHSTAFCKAQTATPLKSPIANSSEHADLLCVLPEQTYAALHACESCRQMHGGLAFSSASANSHCRRGHTWSFFSRKNLRRMRRSCQQAAGTTTLSLHMESIDTMCLISTYICMKWSPSQAAVCWCRMPCRAKVAT